jgi:hypothetical protein
VKWSARDQCEALAIIRDEASITCDGLNRLWFKPKRMSLLKAIRSTCITINSRRRCMSCRAALLLKRIDPRTQR